jgi:hypothetical protein
MNQPLFNPAQRAAFGQIQQANPNLAFGQGFGSSQEGGSMTACTADRVLLAGGQLVSYLKPESIIPLEYVFRRLPIDGIFQATPSTPCQFEMGSIKVPQLMGFVVLDYRFAIYRPSGIVAGEFVELEQNRLPTQVGWNLEADNNRQGNFRYELNPVPPFEKSNPAYQPPPNPGYIPGTPVAVPASDDQFMQARFTAAQSGTGDLSLMPQRHHRQGLLHVPAPWILHSTQTLIPSCHIFRAVTIPIAFFEVEIFGFMLPDGQLDAMQRAIAPCIEKPGGIV